MFLYCLLDLGLEPHPAVAVAAETAADLECTERQFRCEFRDVVVAECSEMSHSRKTSFVVVVVSAE